MEIPRNKNGTFAKNAKRGQLSHAVKEKISQANKGDKNGMWKGGKPLCGKCGVEISWGASFCRKHLERPWLNTPEMIARSTKRLIEIVTNEKTHPRWKGQDVGYVSLHKWVSKHLGKPSRCEECGNGNAKKYEWANKSGLYIRELSDWVRLCTKCHHKKDDIHKKLWIIRKSKMQTSKNG